MFNRFVIFFRCRKETYTLQSHLCKQHWKVATMCSFCGQLFMYKEDLKNHQLCHNGTEHRCFLCGRRRKGEELLRKHILGHYLYEKYGCNLCEKRFKRKKNLEGHLKVVHFVCQYCGNSCKDKLDFKDHIRTHDDLKCRFCLKTFVQKNNLKYHYQLKHGHQDFYKCTICFQRFVIKGRLLEHMKLKHNGVSKFKCKVCNAPFLYWKSYQNHFEEVHAKVKKDDVFKCTFCDFSTDRKFKLQYHVEKTSGSGFFCKKCQIQLDCKGVFDKHMEVHKEDEGIWRCNHCPKVCTSDDRLRHHMSLVHPQAVMAEKPNGHPCLFPQCPKYYITKNSLARHVRKNHADSSHVVRDCNPNTVVCRTPITRVYRQSRKCQKGKQRIVTKSVDVTEECKGYHHMADKPPETLEVDVFSCAVCKLFWFSQELKFKEHMTTHEDEVWENKCSVCDVLSQTPENAVKHCVEEHLKAEFVMS